MKSLAIALLVAIALASLLIVGCAPTAPATAPTTTAPAAPTQAAAPPATAPTAAAKPAAAAPTAMPEKKVAFPQAGKPITMIVPFTAGGGTGASATLLSQIMEKELKTPVKVEYVPGAGSQIGITQLARSAPDGYTLGFVGVPSGLVVALDPERQAVFGRKDIQQIASHWQGQTVVAVRGDSPYKTLEDVLNAARAQPRKIRVPTSGILGPAHLSGLAMEKLANAQFSYIHMDGDAAIVASLLGGHTEVSFSNRVTIFEHLRSGEMRALACLSREESPVLPGVKTAASMGYPVYMGTVSGVNAPAGVPSEIANILAQAIAKAKDDPEHVKKMAELGFDMLYMGPEEYTRYWDEQAKTLEPLIMSIRAEAKK